MTQTNKLLELPLETVIGDRFGRYSKYIIQDRALPDVRDGLKPVQRRILYAMQVDKNTYENNFRKAARTVGTVIGNYHPHGDISVYEAMVRLSQDWKMRYELVEMHGNNGSIDGDPAAAMRYTEARLAKITGELLTDIEKETVDFIPNFDDTREEPIVFPAKLPNLLINGSTGISAGYATNIPPHNLSEVIDAVILKIDKPEATVDELMNKITGPDFPTGGIVQGKDGIKQAFKTGKGRIILRGKTHIKKIRGNREQIVITEIPYDVNKSLLVRKIAELQAERKVEGIAEVRDETDRSGLRIVVELRKDADSNGILNYLFKHTDLQVNYHYNMIAIKERTPTLLSLSQIIDAYIEHQKEVVKRQTTFDLNKAKDRAHIVDGLIKAISILDELIELIRKSENRQNAKDRIIKAFNFSEIQADAILNLQLYRLTNTDITLLTDEKKTLEEKMTAYENILKNPNVLLNTIKKDLQRIKAEYKSKRRTNIEKEIDELEIDIEVTVPTETVVVSLTEEGYIKRTSIRSYGASNVTDLTMKDTDYLNKLWEIETTDQLLLFTNLGRYATIRVHDLPDIRWRESGIHISSFMELEQKEKIIQAIPVREFAPDQYLLFFTKQGLVKKSLLKNYKTTRMARLLIGINLREDDEVINVIQTNGTAQLFLGTKLGYGLRFTEKDISPTGVRTQGVIGIRLKEEDEVISGLSFTEDIDPILCLITHRGACKRIDGNALNESNRARNGSMLLRPLKTKPHQIVNIHLLHNEEADLVINTEKDETIEIKPVNFPISELNSNGSFVIDENEAGYVKRTYQKVIYDNPFGDSTK